MIKIDVSAFIKSLEAARKKFAHAVIEAVRKAARLAADHARASNTFKDRNNELRKSIDVQTVDDHTARVIAPVRHAAWVELGNGFRRPGERFIEPKTKKALRWERDGNVYFAHRVKFSAPRPFMAQAREATMGRFENLCKEAVDNMFT